MVVNQAYTLTISPQLVLTTVVPSSTFANGASVNFTPVTSTGGAIVSAYAVSPALLTGLSMNTTSGAVTGTMPATYAATTYTVTRTDRGSVGSYAVAMATFSMKLALYTTVLVTNQTTSGAANVNFKPVSAAGGVGSYTYAISPALQSGLAINASTGSITGTPSTSQSATTYTVTVTDSDSPTSSSSQQFSLTVNPPMVVSSNVTSAVTSVADSVSFTPTTAAQGTQPYAFTVSPALPGGLSMASGTGLVSGVGTTARALTTYTTTVTEAAGTTGTSTFTLVVYAQLLAKTVTASVALKVATSASTTPVTASGGQGTLSYAISPTLPTGLLFSTSTAKITGTPLASSSATTYTVTVTDSASPVHTASSQFSMAVAP